MFQLTLLACLLAPLICRVKAGNFHTSEKGHLFYVENELMVTWYVALYEYSIRNMSLLTPDTEEKQLEITELITSVDMWHAWTAGLEVQNMLFMWITTDKILTSSNWWEDKPSRESDGTQCIGIQNTLWFSFNCNKFMNFICEEKPILKEKNHELDALKANESESNNQLENSRPLLSNDMQKLTESGNKLECDKHIITERENLLEEKQKEIGDLKNKNEQYLNQLSVAKEQLELKSKKIEMLKEFIEIKLRLLEDEYKMYTGFVNGILQLFK